MKKYIFASLAFAALLSSCNSNEWDVTSDLSVDKQDPTVGLTPVAEKEGMDYAPLIGVYMVTSEHRKRQAHSQISSQRTTGMRQSIM